MRALLKILQNGSYALWITSTVWYMRQKMWKILWGTTSTQWWNATGSTLTPEECSRPLLNKGRRLRVQPKKPKKKQLIILSLEEQKLQIFFRQLPKFWWSSLNRITPWSFSRYRGFCKHLYYTLYETSEGTAIPASQILLQLTMHFLKALR